jgi:DNA replication and repair protein RecF
MKDLPQKERDVEDPDAAHPTVRRVSLRAFRNYEGLEVDLAPGLNVFAGANAQGKTNLLEALHLLATARLLRGQRDAEAIRDEGSRAEVAAELAPGGTRIAVVLERGVRKRASINGLGLPRPSDLLGRLPCVSISAIDMEIVRGEPVERRLFLDLELSSLYPSYLKHLTHYKRSLEQRNALLRDAGRSRVSSDAFGPWEAALARHGAAIRDMRGVYTDRLSPLAAAAHARMGSGEALALAYAPRDEASDEEALVDALAQGRDAEIARGATTVGPHRDDLRIEVAGREARLYGSQGQQRTAVIALKLATLELAREERGEPPLLLLDDIFSDLDERRRALLVEIVLSQAGQTVLTCTEPALAGEAILDRAKVFEVRSGTVTEL